MAWEFPMEWASLPICVICISPTRPPAPFIDFSTIAAAGHYRTGRRLSRFPSPKAFPDGMTVDSEGFVWTAIWFGGRLKRFAPDGALEREIHFPVAQISCVTFGNEDLSEMYITTAASKAADRLKPPGYDPLPELRGGGFYACRIPGIRGRAEFRSRLSF